MTTQPKKRTDPTWDVPARTTSRRNRPPPGLVAPEALAPLRYTTPGRPCQRLILAVWPVAPLVEVIRQQGERGSDLARLDCGQVHEIVLNDLVCLRAQLDGRLPAGCFTLVTSWSPTQITSRPGWISARPSGHT